MWRRRRRRRAASQSTTIRATRPSAVAACSYGRAPLYAAFNISRRCHRAQIERCSAETGRLDDLRVRALARFRLRLLARLWLRVARALVCNWIIRAARRAFDYERVVAPSPPSSLTCLMVTRVVILVVVGLRAFDADSVLSASATTRVRSRAHALRIVETSDARRQ